MTLIDYLNRPDLSRSFVIAEVGVNHEGSLDKAKLMIDQAVNSGCDSVKFQTYKAKSLASKNSPSYWDRNEESTESQFDLFSKYDAFGFREYKILKEYCDVKGIEFATSVFDFKEIDRYDDLLGYYKIASADITNLPLLEKVASKGKPVVLSTGAATLGEIERAYKILEMRGVQIVLLHCVLNYPCKPENAKLRKISYLKDVFPGTEIGYSDHVAPTFDNLHLHIAKMYGAKIIEKHFTYDRNLKGNDHYHSFDEQLMMKYRKEESFIESLNSKDFLNLSSQDSAILNARRSLHFTQDLKKGSIINEDDLSVKRPGTGVSPFELQKVLGLRLTRDVLTDQAVNWNDFK